ncbi:phosphotriesterase-related protein [Alkalispirochaeta americana]|uniref:Phosphotriesterase-related protein n=1 Tax=Alkalispirochaeta americana TaxID=159291 RepID=A0A1N6XQU4_9SPIO|nr:hypothetical protein [Alkalispirochaeta americana]SIR04687.1 phosphotriesterase-related protein [Alkalispirochaeta americana]
MIYSHEHMSLDLSGPKNDPDCRLNDFEATRTELLDLQKKGVDSIIELTARGMGRDVVFLKRLSEETGMRIHAATGYYKVPFLPPEVEQLPVERLAGIMVSEIVDGIMTDSEQGPDGAPVNSGIRAKVIGEIGTSLNTVLPLEEKVFRAACLAHQETGIPISTHTTLGTMGAEQLEIFGEYNIDLSRVVIGHTDLANDFDYIEKLADCGVYIAFDTIGKISYLPEETRVSFIKRLVGKGHQDRILMSVDITRLSHLKSRGGIGYSYLIDTFIPMLYEAGLSESTVDLFMDKNPKSIFGDV